MSQQIVCYLVENFHGNYVPQVALLVDDADGGDAKLYPQGDSMPHIQLLEAQRFLLRHAPPNALVFVNPVPPSLTLSLTDLHEANPE